MGALLRVVRRAVAPVEQVRAELARAAAAVVPLVVLMGQCVVWTVPPVQPLVPLVTVPKVRGTAKVEQVDLVV